MVEVTEYVVFGVAVVANLSLALYFSFWRRSTPTMSTEVEVFLGSRALKVLPLAASSVASLVSSTGLIAFPAHFYAYGVHVAWTWVTAVLYLPLVTQVVVPVIYKVRVTSIFEYLRLRFNSAISLTACAIYILLTQIIGAISIFAASLTVFTVFKTPVLWCNLCIGLYGTIYTAWGGLRGVVWMDCMQLVIMLFAPAAMIAKMLVDSISQSSVIQPLTSYDLRKYIGNFGVDVTMDENVWSCLLGGSATALYRLCFDQVIVQRQLACRTPKEAKRTAMNSTALLIMVYLLTFAMGFCLIVWFRGCDPGLLGDIKSIDQVREAYLSSFQIFIDYFSQTQCTNM